MASINNNDTNNNSIATIRTNDNDNNMLELFDWNDNLITNLLIPCTQNAANIRIFNIISDKYVYENEITDNHYKQTQKIQNALINYITRQIKRLYPEWTNNDNNQSNNDCTVSYSTKPSHYTLVYNNSDNKSNLANNYLFYLFGSYPDSAIYNSELSMVDGSLFIINNINVNCPLILTTENQLHSLFLSGVELLILFNNIDCILLDKELNNQPTNFHQLYSFYKYYYNTIQQINIIYSTIKLDSDNNGIRFAPMNNNVLFGSSEFNFAFSIDYFAELYSKKYGLTKDKLIIKLWHNYFYDKQHKKWIESTEQQAMNNFINDNNLYEHGFVSFVLKPIQVLLSAIINSKPEIYEPIIIKLNINVKYDKNMSCMQLARLIMNSWLPLERNILNSISSQLPSPIQSITKRINNFYNGSRNDDLYNNIYQCNSSGCLMVWVCKLIPTALKGRFYCIGRVYSGKINIADNVNIIASAVNSKPFNKSISSLVLINGNSSYIGSSYNSIGSGNIVVLANLDAYILRQATITSAQNNTKNEFIDNNILNKSAKHTIKVVVDVKNPADLPKLIEGFKSLAKLNNYISCCTEASGEYTISATNEYYLNLAKRQLKVEVNNAELKFSESITNYLETITDNSNFVSCAKTPNKHSRIYTTAEPIQESLSQAIEDRKFKIQHPNNNNNNNNDFDFKSQARLLHTEYNMDMIDARKIWSFNDIKDDNTYANLLCDQTKGVQYLNELKDCLIAAFNMSVNQGILIEQPMRGVKINLVDVIYCADAIHRGAGQLMPAMRRGVYASFIKSKPTLLQPIYSLYVSTPQLYRSEVFSVLHDKQATIIQELDNKHNKTCLIQCELQGRHCIDFNEYINQVSDNKSFISLSSFIRWDRLPGYIYSSDYNQDILVDKQFRQNLNNLLVESQSISSLPIELISIITDYTVNTTSNVELVELVKKLRSRAGLKDQLPEHSNYHDEL